MASTPARRKLKWTDYVPLFGGGRPKGPDETFIVCVERQGEYSNEQLAEFAALCNARLGEGPVVTYGSTYGGDIFELPWRLRDRAYDVMDTLLHAGLNLFTQTRMCVHIPAKDLPVDVHLTPKWLDRQYALGIRREMRSLAKDVFGGDLDKAIDSCTYSNQVVFSHEASWLTEEGHALVRWVRENCRRMCTDSSDEETTQPQPAPAAPGKRPREEPIDIPDEPAPAAKKEALGADDAADTDEGCLVCMAAAPDTLVLPCMHQVVCRACSKQLEQTGDAHMCIQCRRPIDSVLADERV